MKQKIFSLFLALVISAGTIFAGDYNHGTCGYNVKWVFNNGVLTISGTGGMTDFYTYDVPWERFDDDIKSVIVNDGVTSIGNYAFSNCVYLSSLSISNSVTSIGNYAFYRCRRLTSVTIPNSVTSIGNYAFAECTGLISITIPNSVTSIKNQAFYLCTNLTSIRISDLAAWCNISFGASDANPLCYAHNLYLHGELVTDLVIPNSINTIKDYAFYHCKSIISVIIPNSVTNIGARAFEDCSGLTSIEIPNSVTSIGKGAFLDCSSLTSVEIPNSVTSIGGYAFKGCSSLTSATIPNNVTNIGEQTFAYCSSLTSITIPGGVTSIGCQAFISCTNLTSVTCYATTPPELCGVFYDVNCSQIPLYVPTGSIESYKAANEWKDFNPILPIPGTEGIEDIHVDSDNPVKVLHEGQVYILNGEKSYTITGQEL